MLGGLPARSLHNKLQQGRGRDGERGDETKGWKTSLSKTCYSLSFSFTHFLLSLSDFRWYFLYLSFLCSSFLESPKFPFFVIPGMDSMDVCWYILYSRVLRQNKIKLKHAWLQKQSWAKMSRPIAEIFVTLTRTSVSLGENEVSGWQLQELNMS